MPSLPPEKNGQKNDLEIIQPNVPLPMNLEEYPLTQGAEESVTMNLPKLIWTKKDSVSYQVTEADYLALVRAVAHEGKPYNAVAWTLLQRFIFVYPVYPTLESFVTSYAQPINPRWFSDGDLHLAFMKRNAARPERTKAEAARAIQRLGFAKAPLSSLTKYVEIVDAILAGKEKCPVRGAVHYSMSFAKAGDSDETAQQAAGRFAKVRNMGPSIHSGAGFKPGVNWFFAAAGSHKANLCITFENNT